VRGLWMVPGSEVEESGRFQLMGHILFVENPLH
jgi:hypothetical protein